MPPQSGSASPFESPVAPPATSESSNAQKAVQPSQRGKRKRVSGERVIYPNGVQIRYGISLATRWRWERKGELPPRDVFRNGEAVGWKPETLDRADNGLAAA
jgi:hypothetical protein